MLKKLNNIEKKHFEEEINRIGVSTIAGKLGIARNTVYNWVSKGNAPMDKLLQLGALGLDLSYIFSGIRKSVLQNIEQQVNDVGKNYLSSEYVEIPHYNIQAAAGAGKLASDEVTLKPLAFRRDWLANRNLNVAGLAIVGVSGDSMEDHLHDGDLVLVDMSQKEISDGKTYVLRIEGHLLIKNLQMLPHGLVQVASFNPGFPPYTVDLSDQSIDISVIGRVTASMHEW